MVAGEDHGRPQDAVVSVEATFELERFAWAAPDRLELLGTFTGVRTTEATAPALVVDGPEGTHRLPALDGTVTGPLEDGRPWSAEFGWQEAPVPFERATLELERGVTVALPQPGGKRRWTRKETLEVSAPASRPEAVDARGGRLDSGLLAAEEHIRGVLREAQAALDAKDAELERAHAALQGHDADLAELRRGHAAQLERLQDEHAAQLEELQRERAAQLEELRREHAARLDEATREHGAQFEEATREHAAQLEQARRAVEKAHAEAESTLARMAALRDAIGGGS
jgi:hypothetical protein